MILEWRKQNGCFLSIHKAFNFSMYSDLSLLSLLFLCIYQSFLSTYKDIIGKLSIHHIMFFAYGSSKRKWKPFLLLLSLHKLFVCYCQKYENGTISIIFEKHCALILFFQHILIGTFVKHLDNIYTFIVKFRVNFRPIFVQFWFIVR